MRSFKAFSALVSYPTADLLAALPEIRRVLRDERLVAAGTNEGVEQLMDWMAGAELYELEENYVLLFDRSRALSLNLFEHVHGESRDRGQAMIDLKSLYAAHGLEPDSRELPDYLPLFLEFLATLPLAEAREHLADAAHIVSALADRLAKRETPYAAVFRALAELTETDEDAVALVGDDEVSPDDLAALDASWEEAAVTFGAGDAGEACSPERLAIRLRASRRGPAATA